MERTCTFRQVSASLNIAIGTACHIFRRFESTGNVQPTKPDRTSTRLLSGHEELLVMGIITANPTLYLREVCQKVFEATNIVVSASTICRILFRNGLTRKKVQQVALQRSSVYRGEFIAEIQMYRAEQFVWIDESGCDKRDSFRRFGYGFRGERPVCHRILHRGKRVSAIAALSVEGVVALSLTSETVNGDTFFDFVRGELIPHMLPFDGTNPTSIAVLDNCSIHHVEAVIELFKDASILVLWLPPYSPDFNPLENAFSKVKYYLKEHDEIMQVVNDPIPIIQAAFDSISSKDCVGWARNCYYNV